MPVWNGPPIPTPTDSDSLELTENVYHWGIIYPKNLGRKAEMVYNAATVPYSLYMKADMVIRYCTKTMDGLVVKFRYSAKPDLSLEEAFQIIQNMEEQERRDEEYAARAFTHDEFGTLWNPAGLEDEE